MRSASFRVFTPSNALGVGAGAVSLETNDGDIGRTADRGDDELADPITEESRTLAESIGDVGARMHLHLATHTVRRANDPDDRVVAVNTACGGTDGVRASASASGRGPPSLVSRFRG